MNNIKPIYGRQTKLFPYKKITISLLCLVFIFIVFFIKERLWSKHLAQSLDSADNNHLHLAIFVLTSASHFENRQVIRDTWGRKEFTEEKLPATTILGPTFFIGSGPETVNNDRLTKEMEQFGDVYRVQTADEYRLLTEKMINIYRALAELHKDGRRRWPNLYFLKIDDDVFIDLPRVIEMFQNEMIANKDTLFCRIMNDKRPDRNASSKYFVSYQDYPRAVYPVNCDGVAYFFSGEILMRTLEAVSRVKQIPRDDVYLTGLVAAELALKHVLIPNVQLTCPNCYEEICLKKAIEPVTVLHSLSHSELQKIFNCLNN